MNVTSDTSSFSKTSTSWRSEALLVALLALGSALVYLYRPQIPDERRFILALTGAGFFFAPISTRPLRLLIWVPAVALVAWGGRFASMGDGDALLWITCSVVGAALAVRAGGRAAAYYLPEVGSDAGAKMRAVVRGNLQASFVVFAAVFVADGYDAIAPVPRAGLLLVSAVLFVRYLLLQAKFIHIAARPLGLRGLVPAQRWPFLIAVVALGSTRLGDRVLPGGDDGPLLITSMLLLVLAGLILAMSLVRLGWPRALVRRTSFIAGMGLAVALAAVVVELEAWGPARFTSFTTLCMFGLLVVPFALSVTKLFAPYPRASELVGPPVLAVMMAPVTAVNGWRWELTSTGFFFALAALTILYHFVVASREGFGGRLYLLASLAGLGILFFSDGLAWAENGAAWKVFLLALGFVLYSVDLRDRATHVAKLVRA